MNTALLGKLFGWAQFILATLTQVAGNGLPHGALGWLGLAGSLASAIGIHAASSTDGTK